MRWESEKWRKLYRRVDASWLRLPLLARGLGSELLKYAEDDGRIAVMEDEETGEAVCRLMGAHKTERKAVADLAAKLIADGYLVREAGALVIRNFVKAQSRSSSAERQARFRERHGQGRRGNEGDVTYGADRGVTRDVTSNGHSNAPVTGTVTLRSDGSRSLSISSEISDPISADQIPEVPDTACARDSEPRANVTAQAVLFGDAPTEAKSRRGVKRAIPKDWEPKPAAFALGRDLGFDEGRVRHEAGRFVDDAHALKVDDIETFWNAKKFDAARASSTTAPRALDRRQPGGWATGTDPAWDEPEES